jgi:hypothetical protein
MADEHIVRPVRGAARAAFRNDLDDLEPTAGSSCPDHGELEHMSVDLGAAAGAVNDTVVVKPTAQVLFTVCSCSGQEPSVRSP